MNKKKKLIDLDNELDDDINQDDIDDITTDEPVIIESVEPTNNESSGDDMIEVMDDDDAMVDEVIEIDDDDLNLEEVESTPEKLDDDVVLSKHTLQGKHSLKYDSIFKGKKEDPIDEDTVEVFSNFNDNFEVDKSSIYWFESIDNENYIKEKRIKEKVYEVLSQHTDINFLNNRRKPSRVDFNQYYFLLKTHLVEESFSNVELFNELAVYFSDNLFNMFKLLDNKWRNMIIIELQDHIGRQSSTHEITNRNIYIDTEIEFLGEDPSNPGDMIHITGVVTEVDYHNSIFMVNSYEKIYEVKIDDITKILNNAKFKYNLNKLNNIDFL
jgi:hypothetical protein